MKFFNFDFLSSSRKTIFKLGIRIAVLGLVALFAFPALAQEKLHNPYLYRAQKGSKVIHLFGTMHLWVDISLATREF